MMKRKMMKKKMMSTKSTEEALEGGSLEEVVEAGVVVGQSHHKGLVHLQLHDDIEWCEVQVAEASSERWQSRGRRRRRRRERK
jgi:hypothetical protein